MALASTYTCSHTGKACLYVSRSQLKPRALTACKGVVSRVSRQASCELSDTDKSPARLARAGAKSQAFTRAVWRRDEGKRRNAGAAHTAGARSSAPSAELSGGPLVQLGALPLAAPLLGDAWGCWAVLLTCAALGLWSERTELGRRLNGAIVTMILGLAASNLGLVPFVAPSYAIVSQFLLPLAVPLLLLRANMRRVLRETGPMLGAFAIGSVGTIVGTVVAMWLLPLVSLGEDGWKIASALMARHIGGAVNYVAVTEALQVHPSVNTAALAADNLICVLYFATIFAIAGNAPAGKDGEDAPAGSEGGEESGEGAKDADPALEESASFTVTEGMAALALAGVLCAGGSYLAKWLQIAGGTITMTTLLVVVVATVLPRPAARLAAAGEALATILLQVFFAWCGVAGSVAAVISTAPVLFLFSLVQIAVHLAIILGVGRAAGFKLNELLLASNANVGGPPTAGAMANAKGWKALLLPAILVGILGYAVATFIGVGFGYAVLRPMLAETMLKWNGA